DHRHRVTADERIAAEMLAREEHAAREAERGIEIALERRLEALDLHAELIDQEFRGFGVERFRRLHRFAAAVADDQPAIETEFVARGMATEVIAVVENQDSRVRARVPIEPRRREPAEPAADHDEIIGLLDGEAIERKARAIAQVMGGLEGTGMLPTQA